MAHRDRAAGSELFDRHFGSLRRFFASKVGAGIEDLVQQTFLACVVARERLREEQGFRPYLFAVARSKLYDHLREMKRDTGVDPSTISVADLGLTPSVVAASRQEEQIVKEGLRRLPLDLQVALELYYFEGLRGPALARVLDIPEGTVRSRLRRGLDLLRERVEEIVRSPSSASRPRARSHRGPSRSTRSGKAAPPTASRERPTRPGKTL